MYTHVYLPVLLDAQKHKHTEKTLSLIHEKKHTVHQFLGTPHSYTHSTIGSGVFESSNISVGGNLGFCKLCFSPNIRIALNLTDCCTPDFNVLYTHQTLFLLTLFFFYFTLLFGHFNCVCLFIQVWKKH